MVKYENLTKSLFLLILALLSFVHIGYAQKGVTQKKFREKIDLASKKNDYKALAETYFDYAFFEEETNRNRSLSFEYYSRSLDYYKIIDDTSGIYDCKFRLAKHFLHNEMYDDALYEFNHLVYYFSKSNNLPKYAESEINLSEVYMEKLEIESARSSLNLARSILDSVSNSTLERQYLLQEIQYYETVRELDTALILANQCYKENLMIRSEKGIAECLSKRGDIYLGQGNTLSAIYDYKLTLPYFNSIPYSRKRLSIYKNLSKAYKVINHKEDAYNYLEKHLQLKDSILNENRANALNNLTYKYQSEKKSREINILELEKVFAEKSNKQQKRALTVLGIAFSLVCLGLYYIVYFYKEKIKSAFTIKLQNDKINQQKIKELQDQIQIESMQSMLSGQEIERERISKDLHDSLGGLLSTIKLQVDNLKSKESKVERVPEYQKAVTLLDTAVGEVRSISQNLQPVALNELGLIPALRDLINRYNTTDGPEIHLQFFDIPPKLDQMVALGIFRIIQELLNNAIKHAEANEILVQLNRESEDIIIHVEDDGKGFDPNASYKSMGLKNIKSRVNYLKGSIEIDSRKGLGTSFLINVKYNLG